MEVGIRDLRDGLSRYLADVRRGKTLTVTDHGRPIARIVPYDRPTTLEQLVAAGLVRPPRSSRRPTAPTPVRASGSVSELVIEDRR